MVVDDVPPRPAVTRLIVRSGPSRGAKCWVAVIHESEKWQNKGAGDHERAGWRSRTRRARNQVRLSNEKVCDNHGS
jgi:hypothetical protein